MIEFILFRHAKTHPAKHGELDHDRRLTERGRDDAALVARTLYSLGARPDLIVHSDAMRCVETLEAISSIFGNPISSSKPELYLADPQTILQSANTAASFDNCKSVLLIGHNPGIQLCAGNLATGTSENEQRIRTGFPTAAAAFYRRKNEDEAFALKTFMTPKEIKNAGKKPTT